MKTRLKPVYFENQRQAASLLGLDEYDLKEWKADGCPAFKYGRIYHAELLEWIEAKAQKAKPSDGTKGRRSAIGELMFALAKAYEADAITHEQYFEQVATNSRVLLLFAPPITITTSDCSANSMAAVCRCFVGWQTVS